MRKLILPFVAIAAALTLSQCKPTQSSTEWSGLNNTDDSLSYAIGLSIGQNLKNQGIDSLNSQALAKGISDLYQEQGMMEVEDADMYVREELGKRRDALNEAIKQEGKDWLAENSKKEGVVTLPSGLQYKIVREGTGDSPDGNDIVTADYEGRLTNGNIFDSSYEKGTPMTSSLAQVIRGWTEGIPLMKTGGEMEFYIPENLGYGGRPSPGGEIPAYSTLIFKVELHSFEAVD